MTRNDFVMIEPDQLRADFLSSYGFPMETSPDIDGLAREGVRFNKAYTAVPLT